MCGGVESRWQTEGKKEEKEKGRRRVLTSRLDAAE